MRLPVFLFVQKTWWLKPKSEALDCGSGEAGAVPVSHPEVDVPACRGRESCANGTES